MTPPVPNDTPTQAPDSSPCGPTASICTHHYNEGPSVKALIFHESEILSEDIVASGQQQKVRGASTDRNPDQDKRAAVVRA